MQTQIWERHTPDSSQLHVPVSKSVSTEVLYLSDNRGG